jgi:diguanylate cyclase (GGDEF)-like protein
MVLERSAAHLLGVRRSSKLMAPAILRELWETRAARVLGALGLDSVRSTILTLAVVATLIPALATSVLSYRQNRRAIRAKLDEQLSSASSQSARQTDLWLKERLYDLRVFASSYEVTENVARPTPQTRKRVSDYLAAVKDRFADYVELMVVGTDLRTVAGSERVPGSLHFTGPWLQQARLGDPILGAPTRGDAGAPTMEIAVPIQSASGRFLGVLACRLSFQGVEQLLREQVAGGQVRVAVVQAGGQVITAAGGTVAPLSDATLRQLQGADSTVVSFRTPDGLDVVAALAGVPRTDWSAVAEIPAAVAFRDIRRLQVTTAVLLVTLLAVVGSLAYGLGLLIVHPLERLTLAATRVAAGDLEVDLPASGGGELTQLATVFNDMVRRLRESHADLERLSGTDALTGLANRRLLMAELERELRRSERHGNPLALLMLDVDHFKRFNDTYGHPAGDAVLQRLAGILRKSVRDVDTVARYGGEEFLVMLPETPAADAARVSERIRAATEQDRFTPEGGGAALGVTVSVGYAVFPEHGKTADTLIEAADQALYRSKASGRNRVTGGELPGGKSRARG